MPPIPYPRDYTGGGDSSVTDSNRGHINGTTGDAGRNPYDPNDPSQRMSAPSIQIVCDED